MVGVISHEAIARIQELGVNFSDAANTLILNIADIAGHVYDTTYVSVRDFIYTAGDLYNSTYARFLDTVVDTRAEYWLLHPTGQFTTVCSILMVLSFSMAFSIGLRHDINDGCAWVKRQTYGRTRFARAKVEEYQNEQEEEEEDTDDEEDDMEVRNSYFRYGASSAPENDGRSRPNIVTPQRVPPTGLFDPNKSAIQFDTSASPSVGNGPSTPRYQTPFAREYAKTSAAKKSLTMNKPLLQREGLFNGDATLSRAAGNLSLNDGETPLTARLAVDEEERKRRRNEALEYMKKREEDL
jgi:hypothetical protein